MTTPIGSGKTAFYGYEEEGLSCGEESKTCIDDSPRTEMLVCPARPDVDDASAALPKADSGRQEGAACDVLPDYVTVSASASLILHATASATVDRYGRVYTAGGGGASTPGIAGSVMAGYLRDPDHPCDPPSQEVLGNFLVGGALTVGGGAGIGVAATRSSEMWAREIGVTTPQLGASYAVGGRHPDSEMSHGK